MTSWRHEPADYTCPLCRFVAREFDDLNAESDLVAETELALARISPKWWPHNPGGALVMPRQHHENLYDLPAHVGHAVGDLVQQVAVAMRTSYGCDGISTRQHNEPSGGQDVWHLHVHVLPRHRDDRLYANDASSRWATTDERSAYGDLLRGALAWGRTEAMGPDRVPTSQKEQHMTETPQQPSTALTEDEEKVIRSAALRAGALVAQAEPGFLDTFKESFAASSAVKAASPELKKLLAGGLPEMPSGGRAEIDARTLDLLTQAVGILAQKAPYLVEEYRQVVLRSAKDVAAAADDTSEKETQAIGEIERALAG